MRIPQHNLSRFTQYVLLALWMTCLGCTSKSEVQLSPVVGTVTLAGKPAADVMVQFRPSSGSAQNIAIATTDAAGKYTVTTPAHGPGIIPGDYQVTIASRQPFANQLPARYAFPASSKLTAKVEPTGGTFDFSLTAQK